MIRIEVNTPIPEAELTENSAREYSEAGGYNGLRDTDTTLAFDDDKFLVAYSIRSAKSFVMPAEIFLLVGKAYTPKYARATRELLRMLARREHGLATLINVGFRRGCRFAEFLGFRPRGPIIDHAGHQFQLYEVYP